MTKSLIRMLITHPSLSASTTVACLNLTVSCLPVFLYVVYAVHGVGFDKSTIHVHIKMRLLSHVIHLSIVTLCSVHPQFVKHFTSPNKSLCN